MKKLLLRYLPILRWLPAYKLSWLPSDCAAGLTVWAVMVPAALAYAGIAGVHPVAGLYCIPAALIAYTVFGTSRYLVVGPDSATALLSVHTIAGLTLLGSADFIVLTSTLALIVGMLFFGFGLLRMGWVANFISLPVMKGFIQGLAIVTITSQFSELFGVAEVHGEFFHRLYSLSMELHATNPATLAISIGSLVILFVFHRFLPKIPIAFVMVLLAAILVHLFDLHKYGIAVIGSVEKGLPSFAFPELPLSQISPLVHGALAIVLLNYTQSIATAKAAERIDEQVDTQQELFGLGAANICAALSSGFVVAGSVSQSAVNMTTNSKTRVASLVTALMVILTLLFLAPLFETLPMAVLGAIIVKAMFGVLDPGFFRSIYRISKIEFCLTVITFCGVLIIGVLSGVALGVILSILLFIYHGSHPAMAVLGKVRGKDVYKDILRRPEARTIPSILIFRIDTSLFFANAACFSFNVRHKVLESSPPVKTVIINGETMTRIDSTAVLMLFRLVDELADKGIKLVLARVHDDVSERIRLMENEHGRTRLPLHRSIDRAVKLSKC